jgi:hypothetical protein
MSTITSSVPLHARIVSGDTRITLGQITGGDSSRNFDVKSFLVGGMNFASGDSTRGWSSPRIDGAIANSDRHRVLGIDALNFKPTEAMSTYRVHNQDIFIADNNVGAMHSQVEEGSNCASDYNRDSATQQATRNNGLNDQDSNKDVHNPGRDNTGFGLELLTTTHSSILTQGVQNV